VYELIFGYDGLAPHTRMCSSFCLFFCVGYMYELIFGFMIRPLTPEFPLILFHILCSLSVWVDFRLMCIRLLTPEFALVLFHLLCRLSVWVHFRLKCIRPLTPDFALVLFGTSLVCAKCMSWFFALWFGPSHQTLQLFLLVHLFRLSLWFDFRLKCIRPLTPDFALVFIWSFV
jgi:hypothetical protein